MKLSNRLIVAWIVCMAIFGLGALAQVHAQTRAFITVAPEVGIGWDEYTLVPNGTWYQTGAPGNDVSIHGHPFEIGVMGDMPVTNYGGIMMHADYVSLGHASARCYCTTVDSDYNHATHKIAPGSPMALYSGNGMVQGIELSIAPYLSYQGWEIGYKRGVLIYRPEWTDSVYGWPETPTGPFLNGSQSTPTRRQFANVFGVFIRHGNYTVTYEQVRMPVQQNEWAVPPLWTGAHVLMVTYSF